MIAIDGRAAGTPRAPLVSSSNPTAH
jgi:hypothetical protein